MRRNAVGPVSQVAETGPPRLWVKEEVGLPEGNNQLLGSRWCHQETGWGASGSDVCPGCTLQRGRQRRVDCLGHGFNTDCQGSRERAL